MLVIGIDPGLSGAIAVLGDFEQVMKLPVVDKDIDISKVTDWLIDLTRKDNYTLAVIEKVGAMSKNGMKQGVTSMFRFGHATGEVTGMIKTLGIPLMRATPQQWKKVVLAGTSKDKDAAIAYVRMRYPELSLLPTPRSRVPDNGMADAVCIAEYALTRLGKKQVVHNKPKVIQEGDLWG